MGARSQQVRSVIAFVLVVLLLAGCGGGDSVAPPERPVAGGTLRQGLVKVASADPARAVTLSERMLVDHLYDGLTGWDPVGLNARPALAARWSSTPDLRSWTFNLRPGAKAANGQDVVAADVKASLQRAVTTPPGAATADLLTAIVGFAAVRTGATADLSGVVVVDPLTVRIDLDSPMAELPLIMGNPNLGILKFNPDGTTTTTGPFAVESEEKDRSMALVKAPGSGALLDRIAVTFYDNVTLAYDDLVQAKVDWAPVPPEKAQEAGDRYGRHLMRPSLRALFLGFNLENPKFADVRFREAIVRAIDRNTVVRLMTGVDARPLNSLVTDGVPDASATTCDRCQFDPARARQLMAEAFPAGAPPAPPFVIDVPAGPPFNEAALKKITDDLAAVGITATVTVTPVDQYGPRTVAPGREMFQTGWAASYPSFGAFLAPLFYSPSTSNVTVLKDAEVDRRIVAAQATAADRERARAWQDTQATIVRTVPVLPLAQFPTDAAADKRVRGVTPLPTGNFDATSAWLAPVPSPR